VNSLTATSLSASASDAAIGFSPSTGHPCSSAVLVTAKWASGTVCVDDEVGLCCYENPGEVRADLDLTGSDPDRCAQGAPWVEIHDAGEVAGVGRHDRPQPGEPHCAGANDNHPLTGLLLDRCERSFLVRLRLKFERRRVLAIEIHELAMCALFDDLCAVEYNNQICHGDR